MPKLPQSNHPNELNSCSLASEMCRKRDIDFETDLKKETRENLFQIPALLSELPEVKARPGFDQRMAALFAMELETEVNQYNRLRIETRELTG